MDVTRRNANATAASRILALTWRDNARAVRTNQPRLAAIECAFDSDHVVDGNALGDANDKIKAGIDTFKDRIGRKCRWDEDGRCGRARFFHGLRDGVEDRDFIFDKLA